MNNEFVTSELAKQDFTIHNMEQDPVTDFLVFTMTHKTLHPDVEFTVSLISNDNDPEDLMQMQFDGPDNFSDEEATQVLQQVMDTLLIIIEKALDAEEAIANSPVEPDVSNSGDINEQ